MQYSTFCTVSSFVVALMVLLCEGCTAIGYGIGAMADSSNPDSAEVPVRRIYKVAPGTELGASLKDGRVIEGSLVRVDTLGEEVYRKRYSKYVESHPGSLPRFLDTITVHLKEATQDQAGVTGQFVGFGHGSILVKDGPRHLRTINLVEVATIRTGSADNLSPDAMDERILAENVPLRSLIVLRKDSSYVGIALDSVSHFLFDTGEVDARLVGAIVGATIDAIVVAIVASGGIGHSGDGDESTPTGSGGGGGVLGHFLGSCPFAYSFDGKNYELDSETFSGACCKEEERTDLDNLDFLTTADGILRLQIRNELQETEYLNEVSLLVVDHPGTTKIHPTPNGKLVTISSPSPPVSAEDMRKRDIRHLVTARDGNFWVSRGADPSLLRDGIIVQFTRPKGSVRMKAVLTIRNTPWASHISRSILEDTLMRSIVMKESALDVSIWDGSAWRPTEIIRQVGPAISKQYAIEIGLEDIRGNSVDLRLESIAGYWMVDCVQADFSEDHPFVLTELSPIVVTENEGTDRRSEIEHADHSYCILRTGRKLDLTFASPPLNEHHHRSFVLRTRGYYEPTIQAESSEFQVLSVFR